MQLKNKIIILYINILIFAIIYSSLSQIHFRGINLIQDKITDNISSKVAVESFNNYVHIDKEIIKNKSNKLVKEENDKIKKPTYKQRLIDSLYFSNNTACLLGYGDIHPATNLCKSIVSLQGLVTITLILF